MEILVAWMIVAVCTYLLIIGVVYKELKNDAGIVAWMRQEDDLDASADDTTIVAVVKTAILVISIIGWPLILLAIIYNIILNIFKA